MKKAVSIFLVAGIVIAVALWCFLEFFPPPNAHIASAPSLAAFAMPDRDRGLPAALGDSVPAPISTGLGIAPSPSIPADVVPSTLDAEHRHFKRYFKTQLKPSLRDIAREFQTGRSARIAVPLFDGNEVMVVVDSFTSYGEEGGAFTGKIEGDEGSFANIAFYESAESGSIQLPAQNLVYAIQPEPDGSVLIGEVDVAALGSCGSCGETNTGKVP